MLNKIKIIKPALHIYYFAPKKSFKDNLQSKNTLAFFISIWNACSRIGIKDDNHYLKLSAEFPVVSSLDTGFHPLAAKFNKRIKEKIKEKNDYDQQSFFFEHGDYVGLVITLEVGSEITDLTKWNELNQNFGIFFPEPPVKDDAIDCFYLYTGFFLENNDVIATDQRTNLDARDFTKADVAQSIYQALPPFVTNMSGGDSNFFPEVIPEGWSLWHKSFANKNVSLGVLAPNSTATVIEDLYKWSSWASETQISTLVGYLLHLSKLNHAYRVFWNERSQIKEEKDNADKILQSLIFLNENIIKYDINISAEELAKAESELLDAQTKSYGLQYSLSRLRELRRTIKIAQNNMEQFIPLKEVLTNRADTGFFTGNDKKACKLVEQIDIDIEYLQVSQERITEGHNLTRLFQERESKKIARRLNNLILWQGSLLGGLGVGLTALQAFEVKPSVNDSLFLPLSLFLGTLALSLPALFTHWEDGYGKRDYFIGGILASAFAFLFVTFLNTYLNVFTVTLWLWIAHYFLTTVVGFLTGWFMICKLSQLRKKYIKSSFGIPLDDDELLSWISKFLEQTDKPDKNLISPEFQTKLKYLTSSYAESKTILKKHELLNEAHKLYIIKDNKTLKKI